MEKRGGVFLLFLSGSFCLLFSSISMSSFLFSAILFPSLSPSLSHCSPCFLGFLHDLKRAQCSSMVLTPSEASFWERVATFQTSGNITTTGSFGHAHDSFSPQTTTSLGLGSSAAAAEFYNTYAD